MKTTNQKVAQANALTTAATNTLTPSFALTNSLRKHLKNLKAQVTVAGSPEDVKSMNIMLSLLPKPKSISEKIASMDWVSFNLWCWNIIAKQCPSALLKRQMNQKKAIFFKHANYVQQEEFKNIYSVVEGM